MIMNSEDNEDWDIHQRVTTTYKVIQEHIEFTLLYLQNQLSSCCCPPFSWQDTIIVTKNVKVHFPPRPLLHFGFLLACRKPICSNQNAYRVLNEIDYSCKTLNIKCQMANDFQ